MIPLHCKGEENSSMNIRAALLNDEIFRKGYDILNESTWQLTEFANDHIAGSIECNRDGLMYTSVPNDGNWNVTVDGEPAEIVLIGDAMIGLDLSKGKHDIVFTYKNNAFTYGALISTVCLLAFLALIYLSDKEAWNARAVKIYKKFKK